MTLSNFWGAISRELCTPFGFGVGEIPAVLQLLTPETTGLLKNINLNGLLQLLNGIEQEEISRCSKIAIMEYFIAMGEKEIRTADDLLNVLNATSKYMDNSARVKKFIHLIENSEQLLLIVNTLEKSERLDCINTVHLRWENQLREKSRFSFLCALGEGGDKQRKIVDNQHPFYNVMLHKKLPQSLKKMIVAMAELDEIKSESQSPGL